MIEQSSQINNVSQSDSSNVKDQKGEKKILDNENDSNKKNEGSGINRNSSNDYSSSLNNKQKPCFNKICPKLKSLAIKHQPTKSQGFDPKLLCNECLIQYNKQAYCLYCKQIYFDSSDDGKEWILCDSCGRWVHSECANYDPSFDSEFRCIKCKKNELLENQPTLMKKQSIKPNPKQTQRRKFAECSLNAYGFYWQLDPKQLAQDIDKIREYLD